MSSSSNILDWELDSESFIALLGKLIGETRHLQNQPPQYIPREDNASRHIIETLAPYSKDASPPGPLSVRHVSFVEGRGNLIIEYQHPDAVAAGQSKDVVSFVGSHLDVVFANPDNWKRGRMVIRMVIRMVMMN
jgi:acetylornithine deacetylase